MSAYDSGDTGGPDNFIPCDIGTIHVQDLVVGNSICLALLIPSPISASAGDAIQDPSSMP